MSLVSLFILMTLKEDEGLGTGIFDTEDLLLVKLCTLKELFSGEMDNTEIVLDPLLKAEYDTTLEMFLLSIAIAGVSITCGFLLGIGFGSIVIKFLCSYLYPSMYSKSESFSFSSLNSIADFVNESESSPNITVFWFIEYFDKVLSFGCFEMNSSTSTCSVFKEVNDFFLKRKSLPEL
ncbi:hypothetical protein D499_0C01050 [Hanseniaspora uvarum DSM 2768]|nr:hypothetical protein D499_0C01050 [Hanseniaspora uvarum DSM 2768]